MAKTKVRKEEIVTLDSIIEKLDAFKAGDVMVQDVKELKDTELLATGRPSLDFVTDGGFPKGKLIKIAGAKSCGKCLKLGTPVIMSDGSIQAVESINKGDFVMGPDSKPREVISDLTFGSDMMYTIKQRRGDNYTVNSQHILHLNKITYPRYSRFTTSDGKRVADKSKQLNGYVKDTLNINVKEAYRIQQNTPSAFSVRYKGVKSGALMFDNCEELPLAPYILGVWLGDGTSSKPEITTPEPEIVEAIYKQSDLNGGYVTVYEKDKCSQYSIVTERGKDNPFLKCLQKLDILGNKHIPEAYLLSSYANRLELLAGILDTDGYLNTFGSKAGFEIVQKSTQLSKDITRLARSCGFNVNISKRTKEIKSTGFSGEYFVMYISGSVYKIPNRVDRKRAPENSGVKNYELTGIEIVEEGIGEYAGFEVSGDNLFLLGDCTITHNSSLAVQMSPLFGKRILYIDSEYTLTKGYATQLIGEELMKTLDFKIVNAKATEDICDVITAAIPHVDLIIWDSLQNSASSEEWQKDSMERSRANRALVLSKEIPKMVYLMYKYDTTLIVLSQVSQNQDRKFAHDPKYISTGGERLDHNSSLTLWLYPSTKDKNSKEVIYGYDSVRGLDIRVVCEKNKNGIPLRTVRSRFVYGEGYSVHDDVFFAAKNLGIIRQNGAWYSYGDAKIGQGEIKAKSFLLDNEEVLKSIKQEVYQSYILDEADFTAESTDEAINKK